MRKLHTALQNKTLQTAIANLLNKYKNIEGSYASTLINGCASYLLDSGIYSDAFSVTDAFKIKQRVGYESEQDDDNIDAWHASVHDMTDLDCNNLLDAINKLSDLYDNGSVDATNCSYLADDIIRVLQEQEQDL